MKQLSIVFLLHLSIRCLGQEAEFGKLYGGLIYSDTTISQLKAIVDSLNLKFKVCDLTRIYLSKSQTTAHFVSLEGPDVQRAGSDIEAGMPFDIFVKKYKKIKVERELVVLKSKYTDYRGKALTVFSTVALNGKYEHEYEFWNDLEKYDKPLKGKWIRGIHGDDTDASLNAMYVIGEFVS
jgi:hypothetical protein